MSECGLLATCGFFKKYQESKNLACEGFMKIFCNGPKMDQCERKNIDNYRGRHHQMI